MVFLAEPERERDRRPLAGVVGTGEFVRGIDVLE
jgi:hypothetical protein